MLPIDRTSHPLGGYRSRISGRLVFDNRVQVLVFGCAYHRIADETCWATTLRRRWDKRIALGLIDQLHTLALDAYDANVSAHGTLALVATTERWMIECTNAWMNAHKEVVWCKERCASVIAFWLAFSSMVIYRQPTRSGGVATLPVGGPVSPQALTLCVLTHALNLYLRNSDARL